MKAGDAHSTRWIRVPGGRFLMGSDEFYSDESPRHDRVVSAFELAATPITNDEFARFIEETGYVTVAEREIPADNYPDLPASMRTPGSLVFVPTVGPVDLQDWRQWWQWRPGANWRHPEGPDSSIEGRRNHPVVQVAFADAQAFAQWSGGRLPTEAEMEYAAGGGSTDRYAWGPERDRDGQVMANTWRGRFPYQNDGANGWRGTSPVSSFPPNGFGAYDLIGNVWEWTSDEYTTSHQVNRSFGSRVGPDCGCGCSPPATSVAGNDALTQRVLKGGSFLCAPEYCLRYRPAARSPQAEDSSTNHIGFRIARDMQ